MPELPEVETIRRDLQKEVVGLFIEDVQVFDHRVLGTTAPRTFIPQLIGRKIKAVGRRGKAILIDLDGLWLIVQPMMTGQLITTSIPGSEAGARVVFRLSKKNTLVYNDQRLFGRLTIVKHPDDMGYVRMLGPEPLEPGFTADVLRDNLRGKGTAIKTKLLDGRVVAGIGNIYASEALFRAGISPRRKAKNLSLAEMVRLHQAIIETLTIAVHMRGTSMRNYRDGHGQEGKYLKVIQVYSREGQPCRICGTPIRKIVQTARSTYYCSQCQK